jgi:uncharacterized repeat protein (TIGR04138 family)
VSEQQADFLANVRAVAEKAGKYDLHAYLFVFEALEYTLKQAGKRRHVTGRELLEGIRAFSLINFGRMGRTVFNQWGISETADFGRIVFSLVDAGLMSKTETDSLDDFTGGFDFEEVFERNYVPADIPKAGKPNGGKRAKNA